MFTGIIEEIGTVTAAGNRLNINCRTVLSDMKPGASIAVNGVCLTAVEINAGSFSSDLSPETIARSNLGALRPGSRVNLERPMAIGDRLSGHIVQGHVDDAAEFLSLDPLPDGNWWLKVRIPADVVRYAILKGSITLDGVSLTVASIDGVDIGVAVIPHTYQATVIADYRPGTRINVEADMIAKYLEKLLVR
jgi:riboflavin synthase